MVLLVSISFSYGRCKAMEPNQLRYFVEIAKAKNFTQAARNCHVAQPALSQLIRKLELQMGLKLLRRLPRGAELTAEGEVFLPYAQAVLSSLKEAEGVAADLRGVSRGVIKVVSLPSACVYVLPTKIASFTRDHPRIDILLEESVSAKLPELVLSGAFDLGVNQALVPFPGMTRALIFRDDLLL